MAAGFRSLMDVEYDSMYSPLLPADALGGVDVPAGSVSGQEQRPTHSLHSVPTSCKWSSQLTSSSFSSKLITNKPSMSATSTTISSNEQQVQRAHLSWSEQRLEQLLRVAVPRDIASQAFKNAEVLMQTIIICLMASLLNDCKHSPHFTRLLNFIFVCMYRPHGVCTCTSSGR